MNIIKCNVLSENQRREIKELEESCFLLEKLQNHAFLSNEINFNQEFPCFYLGYEEDKLVAFLTTFIPTRTEAEILAVTHPEYRKQGKFHALLLAALEELKTVGTSHILFVVEAKSESGAQVIHSMGLDTIDHSEYRMKWDLHKDSLAKTKQTLSFELVTEENKNLLKQILMEAFEDAEDNDSFIDSVVDSNDRKGFLAFDDTKAVGSFSLNKEDGDCSIYGVSILKQYRGNGYGKQLVYKALEESKKLSNTLVLDVDSKNPVAFSLYQSCGFVITFQVDYYKQIILYADIIYKT
ncbi:MAG: GNAT family N-acetyltransferase [Velocimicrobium sp.]